MARAGGFAVTPERLAGASALALLMVLSTSAPSHADEQAVHVVTYTVSAPGLS